MGHGARRLTSSCRQTRTFHVGMQRGSFHLVRDVDHHYVDFVDDCTPVFRRDTDGLSPPKYL